MNVKTFLVSGIVGGIVNFILEWFFYGILFSNFFPVTGNENYLMTFLGCLTLGLFMAYIFTKWAHISDWKKGLKAGSIIGLFMVLYYAFFSNGQILTEQVNIKTTTIDIGITTTMSALVGVVITLINKQLK